MATADRSEAGTDKTFRETFETAIVDFRELLPEVEKQVTHLRNLRRLIFALASQLQLDVPPDVLASADWRSADVKQLLGRRKKGLAS